MIKSCNPSKCLASEFQALIFNPGSSSLANFIILFYLLVQHSTLITDCISSQKSIAITSARICSFPVGMILYLSLYYLFDPFTCGFTPTSFWRYCRGWQQTFLHSNRFWFYETNIFIFTFNNLIFLFFLLRYLILVYANSIKAL